MIGFVRGKLFQINEDNVLLDCSGIGYIVNIYPALVSELPPVGENIILYTHLQVLDNEFKLYGFLHNAELNLFKTLLGVSGIGARNALNILGAARPQAFIAAVLSGDEKTLITIPGIGKKTAQRLIFELKDKLGDDFTVSVEPSAPGLGDVVEALEVMGFKRSEIIPVVSDLQKNDRFSGTTEDNIKLVLQILNRR